MANLMDHSSFKSRIISEFEFLDTSIDDASNKLDQAISLKSEVDLEEKAAEEAKKEAAMGGLDILAKVESLKHAQQRLKGTNEMHARKVYAERAELAKDLKELQFRVSGVLNEGFTSLRSFEKMLKTRLTQAAREQELAYQKKFEKEILALLALAFEESQMLKLEEESKKLKREEVKNSMFRDQFKDRESVVSILLGDVSPIERFDQPVLQRSGSSQTSSVLPSSSSSSTSSLVLGHRVQIKTVESNKTLKKTVEPVRVANAFVPNLAQKQEGNKNECSEVKVAPLFADTTGAGYTKSPKGFVAQTYAKRAGKPVMWVAGEPVMWWNRG